MPLHLPDRPLTWVFAGDSITQGAHHTYLERTWFELAYERLRFQLDRLEDVVLNTAVSGWTARMVENRYDWLIGRFRPDVLSLALGTNDAKNDWEHHASPDDVVATLTRMADRARADGTEHILLHTPALVMNSAARNRPGFDDYATALRDAAPTMGAILVDHDARWRATWGDVEPVAWMDDHIHPNALGHRIMANTLFEALGVGPFQPVM